MINQVRLHQVWCTNPYKYGVLIPNNHKEAMRFDQDNRNSNWKEAERLELSQVDKYDSFIDLGKGTKPPDGYKRISVYMVYDMKHDGRYKARLVAGRHLTGPPLESVYSGVVSLRSLRIMTF